MHHRLLKPFLFVGGACLVGAALVSDAAAARDSQPNVACNSSTACVSGMNTTAGPGVGGTAVNNNGVNGATYATVFASSGLYGAEYSTNGIGISSQSTKGVAVEGITTDGTGVEGLGNGSHAAGMSIESDSTNNPAVYAFGGTSLNPTLLVQGGSSSGNGGMIVMLGTVNGALIVNDQSNAFFFGLVYTAGGCSSGCSDFPGGRRMLSSAPRASRPTMEDVGAARLQDGVAAVRFDPAFANVIDGARYTVLLSPEGPTRGTLSVTGKSPAGFTVAESAGGRSNAPFAYWVVARPYAGASAREPSIRLAEAKPILVAQPLAGVGLPRTAAGFEPDTNCSRPSPCLVGKNSGSGNGILATSTRHGVKATITGGTGRAAIYGADKTSGGNTNNAGVTGYSSSYRGIDASSSSTSPALVGTASTGTGALALASPCFGCSSDAPLTAYAPNTTAATIVVQGGDSNDTGGTALDAEHSDTTPAFVVDNAGNVHIYGQLFTGGTCKSGCATVRQGQIPPAFAVPRMSVPTMQDSGTSAMRNGAATVRFDRALRSAIDRSAAYAVFLSAEGETKGLYVAVKTGDGFVVRENGGGTSNAPFSYRIVARPYGGNLARLPMVRVGHGPRIVGRSGTAGAARVEY
jgi:hypothetical protein